MHTYNTAGEERKTRWAFTEDAAHVKVANSLISYHWAGAGTTSAPSAASLPNYVIGVNADGASTGNVYHVIDNVWTDTGATVANLYGG